MAHGCIVFQAHVSDRFLCAITAAQDGKVRIWDFRSGKPGLLEINRKKFRNARACQITPDGSYAVATFYRGSKSFDSAYRDGPFLSSFSTAIILLDDERRCVFELEERGKVDSCKMSGDASIIAVGLSGVRPRTWKAAGNSIIILDRDGAELARFSDCLQHETACSKWDLSLDGRHLALISSDARSIELYESGRWNDPPTILSCSDSTPYSLVTFADKGRLVIAVTRDPYRPSTVRVFDIRSGLVLCEAPQSLNGGLLAVSSVMQQLHSKTHDGLEVRLLCKSIDPKNTAVMHSAKFEVQKSSLPCVASGTYGRPVKLPEWQNNYRLPSKKISTKQDSLSIPPQYGREGARMSIDERLGQERSVRSRDAYCNKQKDLGVLLERGRRERTSRSSPSRKTTMPPDPSTGGRQLPDHRRQGNFTSQTNCSSRTELQEFLRKPARILAPKKGPIEPPRPATKLSRSGSPGDAPEAAGIKPPTSASSREKEVDATAAEEYRDRSQTPDSQEHKGSKSLPLQQQLSRACSRSSQELSVKPTVGLVKQPETAMGCEKPLADDGEGLKKYQMGQGELRFVGEEADNEKCRDVRSAADGLVKQPETAMDCEKPLAGDGESLKKYQMGQGELRFGGEEADNEKCRDVQSAADVSPKTGTEARPSTAEIDPSLEKLSPVCRPREESSSELPKEGSTLTVSDETDNTAAKVICFETDDVRGVAAPSATRDSAPKATISLSAPAATMTENAPAATMTENAPTATITEDVESDVIPGTSSSLAQCSVNVRLPLRSAHVSNKDPTPTFKSDPAPTSLVPTRRIVFTSSKKTATTPSPIPPPTTEMPLGMSKASLMGNSDNDESADDNIPIARLRRMAVKNRNRSRTAPGKNNRNATSTKMLASTFQPTKSTERLRQPPRLGPSSNLAGSDCGRLAAEGVNGGQHILKYKPASTVENRRDAAPTAGTSSPVSAGPGGACHPNMNYEEQRARIFDGVGLLPSVGRRERSKGASPPSPTMQHQLRTREAPGQLVRNPEMCISNIAEGVGEQLVLVGTSLLSATSGIPGMVASRYASVEEECLDAGFAGARGTLRGASIRDEAECPPMKLLQEPPVPRANLNPEKNHPQRPPQQTGFGCNALKMEEETVDSANESENKPVLAREGARIAFQKASDRATPSGMRCITGTRAFQVMVELMKTEAGCKGNPSERTIALLLYGKTGPKNICTEDMFLQSFSELLDFAKAHRRQSLENLFNTSLPEGEHTLLIFHARDLLKTVSGEEGIGRFSWSDEEMDYMLETEGSGMVIDKDSFIRAAERMILDSREKLRPNF